MELHEALVVILAAFWAATSAIIAGHAHVTAKRDAIASGYLNGRRLSSDHLWQLFYMDWIWLKSGILLASIIFSVVLWCLPRLLTSDVNEADKALATGLCLFASAAPALAALGFLVGGCVDFFFLKGKLNGAHATSGSEGQVTAELTGALEMKLTAELEAKLEALANQVKTELKEELQAKLKP